MMADNVDPMLSYENYRILKACGSLAGGIMMRHCCSTWNRPELERICLATFGKMIEAAAPE